MSKRPLCVSPLCRSRGYHWDDCEGSPCQGCQPRLAADESRLCRVCTRRLGEDIAAQPELHAELTHNLVGGSGGEKMPSKPGSRVPSPVAMDIRAEIRAHLVSWAKLVVDERGVNPPVKRFIASRPFVGFIGPMPLIELPDDSIAGIARFLAIHVDWLANHDAAGECADEFANLCGRARRIAYPNGTRTIEVGHCQRETDGIRCDGVIKAILRRVDSLLPSAIVCDTDPDHTWDPTQWLRLGRQLKAAA